MLNICFLVSTAEVSALCMYRVRSSELNEALNFASVHFSNWITWGIILSPLSMNCNFFKIIFLLYPKTFCLSLTFFFLSPFENPWTSLHVLRSGVSGCCEWFLRTDRPVSGRLWSVCPLSNHHYQSICSPHVRGFLPFPNQSSAALAQHRWVILVLCRLSNRKWI